MKREYVVVMISAYKFDNDMFVKEVMLPPARSSRSVSSYYNFAYFSKSMTYAEATEAAASYISDGFIVTILNTRTTKDGYNVCFSMLDLVDSFNSIKNSIPDEDEVDEEEENEPRQLKINREPCPNPQMGALVEAEEADEEETDEPMKLKISSVRSYC